MKIVKYAGIALGALVVAFICLGLFVPAFEYSSSVRVNAPVEKCWSVLHDTSRMKKWMPGFVRLTLKRGEPMSPGATYEIVIRQDKLYVMSEILKEVRVPEFATYELTNDVMKSEYDFKLISKNSQTEITSHYKVTGNNLIWKSILLLSKSYLQSESQKELVLLKIEIESGELEFD